jgi:hypothetical protein
MIELNGVRIWAIPYRDRRALSPCKLFCGTVVEAPTETQRARAPSVVPSRIALPSDPEVSIRYSGLFLLPSGDVAAVYGAVIEPLG